MSDATLAAAAQTAAPPPSSGSAHKMWHDGSFGFRDLLDIVNPLQHIPVIGSIYRWATGDEPSDGARVVGDGLYWGPIGLAASAVMTAVSEDSSGHDLGEQVLAGLFGPGNDSPSIGTPVMVASAASAPPSATPAATPAVSAAAGTSPAATPIVSAPAISVAPPPTPLLAAQSNRPAMPLFPGAHGPAVPTPQPPSPAQDPVAQQFLAQTSQLQRQAGGRAPGAPPSNNHVIPLELTGAPLASRPFQMPVGRSAVPAAPLPAAVVNPPPATPDITQKMLEALDKYKKLRDLQEGTGGSNLDLAF